MLRTIAIASIMGAALVTSAAAMSFAPAIPTPVNPHPVNPIATDGSPLPSRWANDWMARPAAPLPDEALGLYSDRYAY